MTLELGGKSPNIIMSDADSKHLLAERLVCVFHAGFLQAELEGEKKPLLRRASPALTPPGWFLSVKSLCLLLQLPRLCSRASSLPLLSQDWGEAQLSANDYCFCIFLQLSQFCFSSLSAYLPSFIVMQFWFSRLLHISSFLIWMNQMH